MNDVSAIKVAGLAKSFGRIEAVRGIDFEVGRGEIFGLLGPDGAGKTTAIRMIVGALDPTSGGGSVLGHDMVRERPKIRERIGYMSQRFSLYGDLTVAENLEYFSEIYEVPRGERAERERQMLEFSRLSPFVGRLAQDLSGGMKQKLALACTLMHKPSVLFLDEPTTGVDPVSRRDFWKILYHLVADGMTIVVSTPYMDEAERCNRIAMMDLGRVLRIDTPERLKSSAGMSLVEVVAEPQRKAREALGEMSFVSDVQVFGDALHVKADDPSAAIPEIRNCLENAGLSVRSIGIKEPELEDAFVAIIADNRRHVAEDPNA